MVRNKEKGNEEDLSDGENPPKDNDTLRKARRQNIKRIKELRLADELADMVRNKEKGNEEEFSDGENPPKDNDILRKARRRNIKKMIIKNKSKLIDDVEATNNNLEYNGDVEGDPTNRDEYRKKQLHKKTIREMKINNNELKNATKENGYDGDFKNEELSITNDSNTPAPQHSNTSTGKIKLGSCARTMFLSKFWRNIFPKRTSWVAYDEQSRDCNFFLLMRILKKHDPRRYGNLDVAMVKKMLIKLYTPYSAQGGSSKSGTLLYKKWKEEYKGKYTLSDTSIEAIIEDATYNISKTDLILIAYHLDVPIVVYYESKSKLKLTNFCKNNQDDSIYYFVKISSRLDEMYLTIYKGNIEFGYSNLSKGLQDALKVCFNNFEDYLRSP